MVNSVNFIDNYFPSKVVTVLNIKSILSAFIMIFLLSLSCVLASEEAEPIVALFTDYQCGVVVRENTATVENTEIDGRKAVKIVPNPEYDDTSTNTLKIDAYTLASLNVDLDRYKWLAVEYKYVSENPQSYDMVAHYKTNGGNLKPEYIQSAQTPSREKIVANKWSHAVFDMRFIDEMLSDDLEVHTLRQMHFLPFGYAKLDGLSKNDAIYIGHIIFMSEEPDIAIRERIAEGFEDGTFRPASPITRAQGCTLIARSIAGNEEIRGSHPFTDVKASEWYSDYIGYCYEKGILTGYTDEFSPDGYMTQNEFARMLYLSSLDEKIGDGDTISTDNSTLITRAQALSLINRSFGNHISKDAIGYDIVMPFFDVDRSHMNFEDIIASCTDFVATNGKWLYNIGSPSFDLNSKIDPDEFYDTAEGNRIIAQLDELEQNRITEIRSTESEYPKNIGKIYYVSTFGSDENSGLSEDAPFATIKKAISVCADGDTVLLQRGCTFRGNVSIDKAITLSAYGKGDKPKIYGSPEDGAVKEMWTLDYEDTVSGKKIWKYLNEDMTDVGNIVFNGGEKYAYKDIPSCTADGGYVIRGNESEVYDYTRELDFDLNFFHSANSKLDTKNGRINISAATGPLYLRCDAGNPGEVFYSIEFSVRANGISVKSDGVTIDNICVMYVGCHGIGSGTRSNLTVRSCELGWIGGSVQHYNNSPNRVTRYGNGIEIYGGCDGYLIENCYLYQCYDAGVTHQYDNSSNGLDLTMYNVTYRENLITECVYSIEYFFIEVNGVIRDGNNVLFEENIMRRCGYGFGSTRPNGYGQRHIRSNPYGNPFRNFVIRNNVMDRSVQDLLRIQFSKEEYKPTMYGNTYIVGVGNDLCTFGYVNGITYPADVTAYATLKTILGELGAKLYFTEHIPYYTYEYTSFN